MTDSGERRNARDIGRDSPAKGSAKAQSIAGSQGGPQEAQTPPRTEKQPPQTSNRRSKRHEHPPTERKSLMAEEDPNRQGRGEARGRTVKKDDAIQGLAGRSGGGRAAGERNEAAAQSGEQSAEHTRRGRQKSPGDRAPRSD